MEKINFYTQSSLNDTPELRMVIDVSGNVGIGESNPTKTLEVVGDISFNGDLYQNGSLFQSGGGGLTDLSATSINDLSDVSFNSTSTTQGNSLIWNNTDKLWEAGTPTTSIVNTTTSNASDWEELTTTGGPPPIRYDAAVVTYQNKLIVSGGAPSASSTNTWELNLDTNVWTEKTSITTTTPAYARHMMAIRYNNKMIVWGGYASNAIYAMWELNLDTYQWSNVTPSGMSHANRYYGASLWGSKIIYITGYSDARGRYETAVTEVDVGSSPYTATTRISHGASGSPDLQWQPNSVVYQDKMFVYGGGNGGQQLWELDLQNYTWSQKTYTGTPPSTNLSAAMTVEHDGNMYIFGGGNRTDGFFKLDLSTLTWSIPTTTTKPSGRYGVMGPSLKYNNKMYLFGGTVVGTQANDTWAYTFPGNEVVTYNPVEINKLSTYYALSVGPNYDTSNMDNSGSLIVEGNVGIGLSDPSGYKLEVAGDISFNGSLYQNGALFTGGSTIDENTDVSMNNLIVHGDISANDASFNVIDATSLRINGVDIIDGAPEALNTLNELATALDNSANFATNVLTTLSNKQDTLTAGTNITITGNTISASGGGLTDLSATSISDLSDVSFNSTTTTQGNSLIWNNTDKLWEAGTPTTSIVNTTTTATNSGGWANLNATNTPAYDYFGDIVYDGNDSFYFVGGRENSSTTRNYVWKYTISTNAWSQVTTTGVTIHNVLEHGLVFYNNALYVFAGYVNGANVNTLYKLDLTQSTPTWSLVSTSGTTPSSRRDLSVTMYNSKLIVFAGYSNAPLNDLYEIDLASGTPTWNQLHNGSGTAPSGRFGSMIEAYQDKIIIFSGGGASDQELWEFNLTNNTWSQKTSTGSIPLYRIWSQHTIVGDKIYMYGGYPNLKNDFYSLDVTTYNWTQITSNITLQGMTGHGVSYANGKIYVYGNNASTTGYTYEYTIPITTTTYNPVEINKLSTYYALSVGPNYDTSNMDNSGSLIVEGNVGIGLSDPSGYKLEVAGDISFNGSLYQNGSLFTGGSTIDETTDVSLNNLDIYGDISAASKMIIQGKIEMGSNDYFSAYQAELHGWNRYGGSRIYSVNYDVDNLYNTTAGYLTGTGVETSFIAYRDGGSTSYTINGRSSMSNVKSFFYYGMDNSTNLTIGGINPTQTQLQSTGYKYTFELRNFYDPNTYARYPKHFVIAGRTTTISNNSNYSNMTSSSDAVLDDWTFICEYQYTGTNSDSASYTNNPHFFNPGTNHTLTNCSFVEAGQNATDINGRASRGYNGRNTEYHIIETTNTSLPLYSGFAMFILDNPTGYTQLRSWNINIEHTQQITIVSKVSLETEGIIIGGKSSSNLVQGYNLDVSGNGIFSGSVTANGSVLSSDDRIKHNEQPITNALSTISKITPKHYFKTKSTLYDATHNFPLNNQNQPLSTSGRPLLLNNDYTIETGIIAQELQTIPELEFTVQNTTPLGVDYNSIHCTHIAATKELHQLVKTQQTTIEEQQTEIEHLKLVNQDTNSQLNAALTELQTIKHYLGI